MHLHGGPVTIMALSILGLGLIGLTASRSDRSDSGLDRLGPSVEHASEDGDGAAPFPRVIAELKDPVPAVANMSLAPEPPPAEKIKTIQSLIKGKELAMALTSLSALSSYDLTSATQTLEDTALEVVLPLPASEHSANATGYELLAKLRPENSAYAVKRDHYRKLFAEAEAQERNRILASLIKSHDKIEGVTWYQHRNQPRFTNSRSTVYLYIGERGGSRWLRMKVQYAASSWLFVREVVAYADGATETLADGNFERGSKSTIWEWSDVSPTASQLRTLERLGSSREAILRFKSKSGYVDKTLSTADKRALLETLRAAELLGARG
jgi:hypothetical protein